MANHITLRPAAGTHVVRAGDTILGTTSRAIQLHEGSYGPVLYVPRDDIDMTRLERSTRTTTCPWKGVASYYSVRTTEGRLDNAVWTYETPKTGLEGIAGYLAFYPSVTVAPA